ncbi:MAG: diphthamide biosynthesis enzyme Dph2 [archaeon]|nr:diphthamide biosynthesis enzyme Dph2 [archaeon]
MQIDTGKIKEAIKAYKAKKVAIQIPEGLKVRALEISDSVEALGVKAVLVADPCFGACDIPDYLMKELGCDMIIHFAHSQYVRKTEIPVIYIEYRSDKDPTGILEKNMSKLSGFGKVGLVTTVQYIDYLGRMKTALEKNGIKAYVGMPKIATYPGQVLGCDQSAAKDVESDVDAFLYVGSGLFHPLGIARATDKPVFCLDVEKKGIYSVEDEKRKYDIRLAMKQHKFDEAKTVGLLATTKKGQMNRDVFAIKDKIEKTGKKVYIISMDYISPDMLLGMKLDVLVNTACPRIEEDLVFSEPVVNWETIQKIL